MVWEISKVAVFKWFVYLSAFRNGLAFNYKKITQIQSFPPYQRQSRTYLIFQIFWELWNPRYLVRFVLGRLIRKCILQTFIYIYSSRTQSTTGVLNYIEQHFDNLHDVSVPGLSRLWCGKVKWSLTKKDTRITKWFGLFICFHCKWHKIKCATLGKNFISRNG